MSVRTPGPWRYQCETTRRFNQPDSAVFEVYTADGEYEHPATCEKEDDARLIATAPELLEVLKHVEKIVDALECIPGNHAERGCLADQVHTAIAKAEGHA
jgi:hypothetical protein